LVHEPVLTLFYLNGVLKINYVTVYIIMMIAPTLGAPFFFGALSDRIGRRNIMGLGLWQWLAIGRCLRGSAPSRTTRVVLTVLAFYAVILVTMV
jgi:MFS family permease